jgi:hypothetical protein
MRKMMRNVAAAAANDDVTESGHALGLNHDATWDKPTYQGQDGWAPVRQLPLVHM